jgi:hypothetical protein
MRDLEKMQPRPSKRVFFELLRRKWAPHRKSGSRLALMIAMEKGNC